MRFIAHRGNVDGVNATFENHPSYIKHALDREYDVEIDVWLKNGELYLGHDCPMYLIDMPFLQQNRLWVHAKNADVLSILFTHKNINWFWHENDQFTLTSQGYIWAFPGNFIDNAIINQPESFDEFWKEPSRFFGVCTDNPKNIKAVIES